MHCIKKISSTVPNFVRSLTYGYKEDGCVQVLSLTSSESVLFYLSLAYDLLSNKFCKSASRNLGDITQLRNLKTYMLFYLYSRNWEEFSKASWSLLFWKWIVCANRDVKEKISIYVPLDIPRDCCQINTARAIPEIWTDVRCRPLLIIMRLYAYYLLSIV